jgi:hypothetical protein
MYINMYWTWYFIHGPYLSARGCIRGPFEKFMDSPYYSESEPCGGRVTVSYFEVPPLASDALLTTLHPLLENVLQTVCRKLQDGSGTGGFALWVHFFVYKALPPLKNRSSFHCIVSISLMDELEGFGIQSRNADTPLRKYLVAPPSWKGFF